MTNTGADAEDVNTDVPLWKTQEYKTRIFSGEMLHENGYRTIGTVCGEKKPRLKGWNVKMIDPRIESVERLVLAHVLQFGEIPETGIASGVDVIGVDADVTDEVEAAAIQAVLFRIFGETPLVRVGQWPKRLFVYRLAEPMFYCRTRKFYALEGRKGMEQVELLGVAADSGNAKQFIADAMHKSGKPYQWIGSHSPYTIDACDDRIPLITVEQVIAAIKECDAILGNSTRFMEASGSVNLPIRDDVKAGRTKIVRERSKSTGAERVRYVREEEDSDYPADQPQHVAWARNYLETTKMPEAGAGRRDATYPGLFFQACLLKTHGIALTTALTMFGEIWNPRLGEHKLKESGPDSVEYHVKGAYLRSQKPFARDVDPSYDFEVLFEVDGTPIKEAIERAGLNVEDLLRQPPPPPNDEGEEDAPEEEETWEEVKDGDAPPPPPPPGLQFTSSATARKQGLKPPEFLVDGLLPLNSVTLLTGAGAVGKSMLSQLLGSCVAIGAPFLGRATTPGKVIALYSEDETDELGRRQAAIEDHIKVEVPDGDFVWLDADAIAERQSGIALMSFDRNGNPKLTPFFKLVEAAIIAHTPRLLIIDHAASAFLGHSMMQVQVQAFMGALVRLCRKHSCNIVLLAHPSLSSIQERRASGTLQWENTVRSQLSMDYVRGKEGRQLKEVPRRELTLTKANRGNQGWTTTIEWHPYGNSGLFDLPPNPFDGPYDEAAECDRRFMQAVRGRLAREGRERVLNRNVTGPYFAPRLIAEEVGRSVDQMEAAMQRAFDAELIHLVEGVKKQPDHIELGPAPVATDA